jgi:chromosome segregation ATPase
LEVIAEESRKSSALESQLKAERERSSSLETELRATKRALAERESELSRSDDRIEVLEGELKAALEVCLISYLKDHKGVISTKDYASELEIGESRIKEALDALAKRGKIKIA